MAREQRNIGTKVIWISMETYTEYDKDDCDYYGKNKEGKQIKPSNERINSSDFLEGGDLEKEVECSRCHGSGKVETWDGSYNISYGSGDGRGSKMITCPICLGKGKLLH